MFETVSEHESGSRRERDPRSAELATLRILLIGVAVTVAVVAFVALAVADKTRRVQIPVWLVAIIVLVYVVLVVVAVASPWLPARALRAGAAVGVGSFFAALVLFAPASGVLAGTAAGETIPWPLTAFGGIAVAAVVAGGARLGWSAIVVWVVFLAAYRVMLGGYTVIGLANDAQALTTAATLCAIAAHAVRTSRDLDATAARATSVVAEQGAARGRLAARARVAAFVHDEVLAALHGAAEGAPGTAAAVRDQALRASAVIDADRGANDWTEQLRALAAAAGAGFAVQTVGRPVVPERLVTEAVVVAARQALENSVLHAGPCRRGVEIDIGEHDISIRITDDGIGFAREDAGAGRMGITASIEGSMRDVAGGVARVASRPGAGTTVTLRWTDAGEPDDEPIGAASSGRVFDRAGGVVAAVLFVVTQTVVAVGAAVAEPMSWTPIVVLAGILIAAALTLPGLSRRGLRCAVAVALVCATILGAVLATPPPLDYGSAWFLPAAGFVLVAVALNARPRLALAGSVVLLGMLVAVALMRGGHPVQLASIGVRTATIVGLGTLLSVSIVRMRRSQRAFSRRAIRATEQREWDAAVRRELEDHAAALDDLAGPLLARVAAGELLEPAERAHARAIEGRLRDGYRAGRLLKQPLIEAAMRARTRGVDVVLLDDSGAREIDDAAASAVAEWMRAALDSAGERFVGRLLPPGRSYGAQVVVDGRVQNLPV